MTRAGAGTVRESGGMVLAHVHAAIATTVGVFRAGHLVAGATQPQSRQGVDGAWRTMRADADTIETDDFALLGHLCLILTDDLIAGLALHGV